MKRLFYTFFALYLTFFSLNAQKIQQTKDKGRPTIAVVLAGGGAKGTAHIGALKVIESCGIPIDMIVGTSMGSIVGGLYSIGYTTSELEDITKGTDWINLIIDTPDYGNRLLTSKKDQESYILRLALDNSMMLSSTGKGGLLHGKNIAALFNHLTEGVPQKMKFDKLPIQFACVATDVITGEKYVFKEGSIVTAMRSSMAIPGVFTPVKLGKRTLVDGFVVDNYPVDVAKQMGADIVIGVDLVSDKSDDAIANSAMDLTMRLMDMISKDQYEENIANSDIYIKVDTKGYSAASFNSASIDSLIIRGEEAGNRCIKQLKDLAQRLNIKPQGGQYNHPRMDGVKYYHTIEDISNIDLSDAYLDTEEDDDSLRFDKDKLTAKGYQYARNVFKSGTLNIGGRFDNQYFASLQFGIDMRLSKKKKTNLYLYARLGDHLASRVAFSKVFNNGGRVEARYLFEKKNLGLHAEGVKVLGMTDLHHRFNIRYKQIWSKVAYSFGLRYDIDRYTDKLTDNLDIIQSGELAALEKESYASYYAKAEYNSLNSLYFPTKGTQVETMVELITTNFHNYNGYAPVPIISGYWRSAFGIGDRFSIIPRVQARMVFPGESIDETPMALINIIGGLGRDLIKEQQMVMSGLPYTEITATEAVVTGGVELQQRLWKNHYIIASGDVSSCCDKIDEAFEDYSLDWGVNLGYHIRTFAGPISLIGMYNSRTKKGGVIFNIGYYF